MMKKNHIIAICDYSHSILYNPDSLPCLDMVLAGLSDAVFNDSRCNGTAFLNIIACDTDDPESDIPYVKSQMFDSDIKEENYPSYSGRFRGNLPICNGIKKCCTVMERYPFSEYIVFLIVSNVPSGFESFQNVLEQALTDCEQFKNAKRVLINLSNRDAISEFYRVFPTRDIEDKLQIFIPSDNIDYGNLIFGRL